jgi:hypothetical protein
MSFKAPKKKSFVNFGPGAVMHKISYGCLTTKFTTGECWLQKAKLKHCNFFQDMDSLT